MFTIVKTTEKLAWLVIAANEILLELQCPLNTCRSTSIMLTGGRAAKKLYNRLSSEKFFLDYTVGFYFGDERCVPPEDLESNYGMVMNTLFSSGVPENCNVHRMAGEAVDVEREALRYESLLPKTLNIIILSVGEDGHIASIFPGSHVITEETASISHITAPKAPVNRITITPKILKSANKIIVLACGAVKGKVVARALNQPKHSDKLPIAIIIGMPQATIILDKEASEQLQ